MGVHHVSKCAETGEIQCVYVVIGDMMVVAKSVMIKSLMTGALGRRSSRGKEQTTESQPRSEATYPKGVIKGSGGRGNVCSFAREGVVSCMTKSSGYEALHCRSCCILAVECPVEKSQFV